MVAMSSTFNVDTSASGGVFKSLKRKFFAGESIFQNTYYAKQDNSELYITSEAMGDIQHRYLDDEEIILSRGAYVAGSKNLTIDTKWGGLKGFLAKEGLFFLKVAGKGDLFFSSFGAIEEININNSSYTVDNGHIVGFEPTLNYEIKKIGGLKSLFLSGEGIVCEFKGSGKLYIQTRNTSSFVFWSDKFRKVQRKSGMDI